LIALAGLWLLAGRNRAVDPVAKVPAAPAAKPGQETSNLPPPGAKVRLSDPRSPHCDRSALLHPEDAPVEFARLEAAGSSLLKDIGAQLSTQGLPAKRALGQYLQMFAAADQSRSEAEAKEPQCATRDGCPDLAARAAEQGARGYRDALAQLATQGSDPQVYALAYYACAGTKASVDPGQCAQVSALQWARIEPANVVPWLYLAGEAAARHQAPLVEDALFHASRAQASDSHWSTLAGLLDTNAYQAAPQDVQDAAVVTALGVVTAFSIPQYQAIVKFCSIDGVQDANRHQLCDALASVMTEHADTLISVHLGTHIGERLGWSAQRLQSLGDAKDAMFQLGRERSGGGSDDCQALPKFRAWTIALLRYGEIGAFQRTLALTRQTEAQLAQRYRVELVQQRELEAAAREAPPAADPNAAAANSAPREGQETAPSGPNGIGGRL